MKLDDQIISFIRLYYKTPADFILRVRIRIRVRFQQINRFLLFTA